MMPFYQRGLWFGALGVCMATSLGLTVSLLQMPEDLADLADNAASLHEIMEEKQAEEVITMLFTGDIMLGRYIKTLRERNGGDFPFTHMPEIINAVETELNVESLDLVVGNLEGPITDSDYVNPGTAMRFNFDPEVAPLLAEVGFTTLSMANNHTYDQGTDGLQQTHSYLEAVGIEAFGHPDIPNGEWSFITYDFDTISIGFLGLNDAVFPLDEAAALAEIQVLDSQVDFLIIGVHWGAEYESTARSSITELAHAMVDAGADFIWGHHPHVVQNDEVYKDAPIYYSLGNFVFDQYWSQATQEGLVVGLRLDGTQISTTEIMVDLINQGEPKPR